MAADISFGDFKNSASFTDDTKLKTTAVDTKTSLFGATGELAVGYGYVFPNCVYLGGDIFGGLSSLKGENSFRGKITTNPNGSAQLLETTSSLKMTGFYGARFRPGVLLGKRTVFHGTVGVTSAQWKAHANGDTKIDPEMATVNCKKWRTGFTFGAGMMTQMTNRMSVGLEFTHTTYKSFKANQLVDPTLVTNPEYINYTFKPQTNQIMLKFAYHFGKKGAASAPVAA